VDAEELERIASRISAQTGLDDRPLCDPYTIARALGLTVRFVRGLPPHTNGALIVIPSTAHEQAQAYFIAHEVGHFLLRGEERCEELERACSRVGVALMLPARPFARDLAHGWSTLQELWPLASRTVIRRRASELTRLPSTDASQ
jgi:hypothetical protein